MSLTAIERMTRRVLIDRATQGDVITYGELANQLEDYSPVRLEQPWSPMFHWLGAVMRFEFKHDRPLLTAIVVRSGNGEEPGDGFFTAARVLRTDIGDFPTEHAFWVSELNATFAYWSGGSEDDEGTAALADHDVWELELEDGTPVKVRHYVDGRVRVVLGDGPWQIAGASLGRNSKGMSIVTFVPSYERHCTQRSARVVSRRRRSGPNAV